MSPDPQSYVDQYLADRQGAPSDLDRSVTTSSGLDAQGILDVIANPALGRQAIEVMADLMHPTDSMYYDAIYGAYHGQSAIRNWLVPTMEEIAFITFVPQQPGALFDDGEGATSVDEWQMFAEIGDDTVPLSKGVSVRRYRDGWITWNADVYDTGSFRTPMAPGGEAPDLPPVPPLDWTTTSVDQPRLSDEASMWLERRVAGGTTESSGLDHVDMDALLHHRDTAWDFDVMADLCHPDASVYIDPLFGEFRGQSAIRGWLTDVMSKVGNIRFDPIGPSLCNGDVSVEEWMQVAVQPNGSVVSMMRGTSVRRFKDGWIVYAADYFDTASLVDRAVQAAGIAAGATLTAADIARYRE